MKLHHITLEKNLPSILERGIMPAAMLGVPERDIGEGNNVVWLSQNPFDAMQADDIEYMKRKAANGDNGCRELLECKTHHLFTPSVTEPSVILTVELLSKSNKLWRLRDCNKSSAYDFPSALKYWWVYCGVIKPQRIIAAQRIEIKVAA
jgi:hypothetical protein